MRPVLDMLFSHQYVSTGVDRRHQTSGIASMQVIAEVCVGQPEMGNAAWIGITAVIVVVAYAVAVAVPNIWPVMVSLLGVPYLHFDCCTLTTQLPCFEELTCTAP